jgi:hypothetical protein
MKSGTISLVVLRAGNQSKPFTCGNQCLDAAQKLEAYIVPQPSLPNDFSPYLIVILLIHYGLASSR